MKRVFSFVLALAMLLAMSIPVFAEEETYTTVNLGTEILSTETGASGTITITNAIHDTEYKVYKIFGAKIAPDKDPEDKDGVTYVIDPNTKAFGHLFGSVENPTNPHFNYDPDDNRITLKNTTTNSTTLVAYFKELINSHSADFPYVVKEAVGVTDDEGNVTEQEVSVEFTGLQYGYYLIESSLGVVATLDSNTPSMSVIDKNQTPGKVDKSVKKDGEDYNTVSNNVNIGDVVTYKIEVEATNYAGQEKIRYYEIFDSKGTGIWAEFNSFRVEINGQLQPGYYVNQGGDNTDNWTDLDSWAEGTTPDIQTAAWYLVHTGYDTYSILIPWIEGHTVRDNGNGTQTVIVPDDGVSKYDSPVTVKITYDAAIEPNASIGGGNDNHANLFNEAHLEWHSKYTQGSTGKDKVYSETYGLTILKEDFNTQENLDGATFLVYKGGTEDADGNVTFGPRVYVIPTGVDGVYMVDSKNTGSEGFSGDKMDDAREYFEYLRDPNGNRIGGDDENAWVMNEALKDLGESQTNQVVTAENGRLVILGLEPGTYYFEEIKAPDGYNKLDKPFSITITKTSNESISIYADDEGNVMADNTDADYTYAYYLTNQVVKNNKGAELPATGGEGRIMLISVGALIAMCFAVLLITQKKMSIYRD